MDAAGTVNAVIGMSIPAVATIVIGLLLRRLHRTRRARDAAEGTSRTPALIVAVGWMSGVSRLDSAHRAYAWLLGQVIDGAVQHLDLDRTPRQQRGQAAGAFTITYRETWR